MIVLEGGDAGRPPVATSAAPARLAFRPPDYADRVPEREACLVDVYDTLLSCDFVAHSAELPLLAGLSMQAWGQGYSQVGAALGIGQLTKAEGFERILRDGGVEPRPDLVGALVDRDRELLRRSARLYDDALPFLRDVRARGIKIAIVSNCSEHTRDLLESNGVAELADTLVLSCEVGAEKPAAEIFTHALDQLGVPPGTPCSWTTSRRSARERWAWASPRCRSCGVSWTGRCRHRAPRWSARYRTSRRCSERICPSRGARVPAWAPARRPGRARRRTS